MKRDESLNRKVEPSRLVGDASKARAVLNWEPENNFEGLIEEMTRVALAQATRSQ